MPDFNAPFSASPNSGGLRTLKDMMSLRLSQQALQQGQLSMEGQQSSNQSAAAKASVDTRTASEQAKLAAIPWDSFEKDDGSFDVDGARRMALKVAPTTGADFAQRLNDTAKGSAETKKAFQSLNDQQQQGIRSALGSWGADPNASVEQLQQQGELAKANAPDATKAQMGKVIDHAISALTGPDLVTGAPKSIQQQKQAAVAFSRAGLSNAEVSGPGGLATPSNIIVNNGATQAPMVQAPALSGGGLTAAPGAVTNQTPPANMTAPNGQIVHVGAGGGGLPSLGGGAPAAPGAAPASRGLSAAPARARTAQDDAPGPNSTDLQRQQYAASAGQAQKDVLDARETDKGYGNSIAISKAIRHLAPEADTGPGRDALNKILAGVGANVGTSNQELGAFLDRQAATLRTQMGLPGTNAGAEDSKQIAGHTGYTAQAIMDKNDYTQALVEGAHQYRNGLDRVEGFSGQASPKAVNAFKNAWTNNFDPNVYKLDIAKEQGPEAFKKFVNSLDPKEAASLSQKRKNLQALSNGQIPQ